MWKRGVVGACQVGEEVGGPGTGVTAVLGQTLVGLQTGDAGQGYERAVGAHAVEVGVVLDAGEAVLVGHQVLVHEDLVRAFEGCRDDEAAAAIDEGRQDLRGDDGLFDGGDARLLGCAADDADDRDGRVGCLCAADRFDHEALGGVGGAGARSLLVVFAGMRGSGGGLVCG